jgi:hypothetical protein
MWWGLLFGLLFFVPLLGAALGAGFGALAGSLSDAGIDDEFIKSVREEVEPGTSALFLLTSDAGRRPGPRGAGRDPRPAHPHQPVPRAGSGPARGLLRVVVPARAREEQH